MTKQLVLTCVCTICMCTLLLSQSPVGKITVSTGVGIIPTYVKAGEVNTPALSLEFGYRISELFSISTFTGYTALTSQSTVHADGLESKVKNKTSMFGIKSQVHKTLTEKIGIFGGLTFGVAKFSTSEFNTKTGEIVQRGIDEPTPYNPNAPKSGLLYAGNIGVRYLVTHNISAYSELGYGISIATLGLSIQL